MAAPKRKFIKKKTKKSTTSKKERHSDFFSKKVLPKPRPDPEEDGTWDDFDDGEVFDDSRVDTAIEEAKASQEPSRVPHVKYPPPKKNPIFVRKWKELIPTITSRDNFKTAYLSQVEILCDLFVEYDDLSKFLRTNGYTYEAFGRQGKAIKSFPQVLQLNRVKTEIRNYSKILGLLISKDKDSGGAEAEEGDWE